MTPHVPFTCRRGKKRATDRQKRHSVPGAMGLSTDGALESRIAEVAEVLNLRDSLVAWAPECGHSDPHTDRFADKVSVKRTICPGQAEPVRTMSLGKWVPLQLTICALPPSSRLGFRGRLYLPSCLRNMRDSISDGMAWCLLNSEL